MKKRLDVLLLEKGLVTSREKAQALILAGHVLVDDTPARKAGQPVSEEALIRIRGEGHPYVSRGGIKLAAALDAFEIPALGRVGLDIGASTGGFTQVLLLRGAIRVHAVDVGHNQLDWIIRKDERVKVYEKVNARYAEFSLIGERVDLIVVDVSFISLEKILPGLVQFAHAETDWITLIKPQFEVGRDRIGKGGIVQSAEARSEAVERLSRFAETLGLVRRGLIESPITGTEGNKEYLAHWKRS
ncbi:MAG: TlyA family RNA methyltransferase [Oligoflexia bacterium]|nr:TlyA family RNA methyltransferase [Oligoflexia bacterium]